MMDRDARDGKTEILTMPCGCKSCFARTRGFEVPAPESFAGDFSCRLGSAPEPLTLLLDLDFSTPVTQLFPTTAAALATIFGNRTADTIYDFQEASGNPVIDHVGSATLGTFVGANRQATLCPGIWNGTDWTSKLSIDWPLGSARTVSANNNTDHDFTNGSWAWLFVARFKNTAALLDTFSKRSGALVTDPGYEMQLDGAGRTQFRISDGVAEVNEGLPVVVEEGGYHVFAYVCDRNIDEIYIVSDVGQSAGSDISAIGSLTNGATFLLGNGVTISQGFGVLYMALFTGADAEGIAQSDIQSFWTHGTDPTGLLTTNLIGNNHSVHLGSDADGVLLGECLPAAVTGGNTPLAYDAALSNANKIGLDCRRGMTSLISDSDFFGAPWVRTNMFWQLADFRVMQSPRRAYETGWLLAQAANATAEYTFACAPSTAYTFQFYVARWIAIGTDVPGALIAWDTTGGAQLAIQTFTATAQWQIVELRFTTNPGQVQCGFRIRIDANNDQLGAFRCTAVAGDMIVPIQSMGAAATISPTEMEVAGSDGQYIRGNAGEIEALCVCHESAVASAQRYLCDARNGNANEDRRDMRVQADETLRCEPYDRTGVSAGTVDSAVYAWNAERTCRFQWNRKGAALLAPAPTDRVVNGVDGNLVGGIASNWSGKNNAETIYVGQDGAAAPSNHLQGLLSRLRIWNQCRPV
jgi:hypothetical protein